MFLLATHLCGLPVSFSANIRLTCDTISRFLYDKTRAPESGRLLLQLLNIHSVRRYKYTGARLFSGTSPSSVLLQQTSPSPILLLPMATRANLTVDDVLGELDRDEYESDSEDDFDGYVDTTEREQHNNAVEEPILEHMWSDNFPMWRSPRSPAVMTVMILSLSTLVSQGAPFLWETTTDQFTTSPTSSPMTCCRKLSLRQTSMHSSTSRVMISLLTPESEWMNVVQWHDKRLVSVLSTVHDDTPVAVERRSRRAPGGRETVEKPQAVVKYNKYMGGVDHGDQLLTYYGYSHRTRKWWRRAFFFLFDAAVVNSYTLYRQQQQERGGRCLTHEQFRVELAKNLLAEANTATPLSTAAALSATPASHGQRTEVLNPQSRLHN